MFRKQRRPGAAVPPVLYDIEPDRIDATEKDRLEHLKKIIEKVLEDTDPGPENARRRAWLLWFFLYIMWWESAHLTKRKQVKGPARGLIQMEPATLWDILTAYVVKTDGCVANLAKAAGVTEDEMKKAIEDFLRKNKKAGGGAKNEWPAGAPGSKLEEWLRDNDAFAVKLMRYFWRRWKDKGVPPANGGDLAKDPQDDAFKPEHAKGWGDGWNKGEEGRKKQGKYAEDAKKADKALKE